MTQMVTREEKKPQSGDALLAVIERAARDPGTDVDKMERLMAMYERGQAKIAEAAFNDAMSHVQSHIGRVGVDASNPQTRSKYATYAKLDSAIRGVYTEAGFSLSFDTGNDAPENCVRVLCYVSHKAGHSRTYHIDMPSDGKGAKGGDVMTKTHAAGSAASYGMRYLLKMIFNVAVGEEDDDGVTAAETVEFTQLRSEVGRCITVPELELLGGKIATANITSGEKQQLRGIYSTRKKELTDAPAVG